MQSWARDFSRNHFTSLFQHKEEGPQDSSTQAARRAEGEGEDDACSEQAGARTNKGQEATGRCSEDAKVQPQCL